MKKTILIALALVLTKVYAQDTLKTKALTFSGYVELYYSYDLGNPVNHERPSFFYSFNRHNEANLNIGFVKANYSLDNVRGNFALMGGTYAQYNLAGEQGLLRNIFEANAGFKISKNNNLWVDAGIMPSHIGFESSIGKDCWNLTRSLLADNTPYFEAGVKLGYTTKNDKLYLAVMYLNGWQRIQRVPANQTPAFGTQLTYKPTSTITLNWSTYAGNEQPDSLKLMRYYNNFYGQFQITEKFGVTAGFDIGIQQKTKDTNSYNTLYSPIIILLYKPNSKIRIGARAEYYSDEKGVIIATRTPNGFQTIGYSLNYDYLPANNIMFRIEGRALSSKDKIFSLENKPSTQNYFITTSLCLHF
ncbi:MAG: porin [Bacteroidia bacterium]|nr:porin [Bacteroidia bacterium]